MTDYILTGHKGAGKSLIAVGMAQKYLRAGRRVASNITLYPDKLVKPTNRQCVFKLPGYPRAEDFELLGRGYEGSYDESKFGLCILDEAGSWLNAHDWKDPGRRDLFRWLTHARKLGWDVVMIIQDWESLDGQTRRSITEIYTSCARLDRLKILGIGLPKLHVATHRYKGPNGLKVGRDIYWGTDLYAGYDTNEYVRKDETYTENGVIDARGSYTILSAWHTRGRYLPPPTPLHLRAWYACLRGLIYSLRAACFPLYLYVWFRAATGQARSAWPRSGAESRRPGRVAKLRPASLCSKRADRVTAPMGSA